MRFFLLVFLSFGVFCSFASERYSVFNGTDRPVALVLIDGENFVSAFIPVNSCVWYSDQVLENFTSILIIYNSLIIRRKPGNHSVVSDGSLAKTIPYDHSHNCSAFDLYYSSEEYK